MFEVIDNTSERIYIIQCNNIGPGIRLLEENMLEFIKNDNRDMVIDLEKQEIMNSLLLSLLIRTRRNMTDKNRDLAIRNCNPQMYRCIEMADLESFFKFINLKV